MDLKPIQPFLYPEEGLRTVIVCLLNRRQEDITRSSESPSGIESPNRGGFFKEMRGKLAGLPQYI